MTALIDIIFSIQTQGGLTVLRGAHGEMQVLDGVTHVSVFPPFEQEGEGPTIDHIYQMRATDRITNQAIQLPNMRFGGIAPHVGTARFAD